MRKFVISDLHGDGALYRSIMCYLDSLSLKEDVSLYIDGDLIDRGEDSFPILMDVMNRIKNGNFPITYLGGNHEQMMYQVYDKRFRGLSTNYNNWYRNGGWITDQKLVDTLKTKEEIFELIDRISHLKLYHIMDEKIQNQNIILVHAACLDTVNKNNPLEIKDDTIQTDSFLWTRENDPYFGFRCDINRSPFFAIVGHTPNGKELGYEYHKKDSFLNIDGSFRDTMAMVEVQDGYLRILSFNNRNEIVAGSYLDGKGEYSFHKKELKEENKILQKTFQ